VLSTPSAEALQFKNLSSVCVDDIKCAEQAVDYLFDNGHKKIGIIGGELDLTNTSGLRLKGCQKSFEKHGYVFDDSCFCQSHYSLQEAYEKTKQMLKDNNGITAFFAMSDMMAFGAISAISDMGLKVPQDISVIGFNGIELGGYYCPKLTTLRQPCEEIASKSVRMLLRSIQGDEPSCHITLDIEFVLCESVRSLL
jgi:LacI family transcriptional regulator